MGSLIKVVASSSSRLPRCLISSSSRALAATHQRCFCSTTTINDDSRDGHDFKNNLNRVRNIAVHRMSNFIYENIMNRFGLFPTRVFCICTRKIGPHTQMEDDEGLYGYFQIKGVTSHENVRVYVDHNKFHVQAIAYDELKATYSKYECNCLLPEDMYYLNWDMRGTRAEFSEGELLLTIPKFYEAERMMNQKKHEAGEFSKLTIDAFMFYVKVNVFVFDT